MQFGVRKRGYSLLVMIASPLLTLTLGGVGWASFATPGVTPFLEIDGNIRYNGPAPAGACEGGPTVNTGGLPTGAGCAMNSDCASNKCVGFDWANGPDSAGACSTLTTGEIHCPGTNGLFDGGIFNGASATPTVPKFQTSDPTIIAEAFAADELGISGNVAGACANLSNPSLPTGSAAPCICKPAVPGGPCAVIPGNCPGGETCVNCGSGDPTTYTGVMSEKNGDILSTDTYGTATVPNKDEIANVYAIDHQDPPRPSTSSPTDINEVVAGFERVVNNGDSHVDLEFLQAGVKLVPGSKPALFPCQGLFDGHRTAGDLLVATDFAKGGGQPNQVLYRWTCNASAGTCAGGTSTSACTKNSDCSSGTCRCDPPAGVYLQESAGLCKGGANDGGDCDQAVSSTCPSPGVCKAITAQAVNPAPISCGGWACRTAAGAQISTVDSNEFYEVGIDLAAAKFTGCISTFLPHTRSTKEFTAVLKDFALLQFNTCQPTTKLTKTVCETGSTTNCGSPITITTGGSVTYTYKETNDNSQPVPLTNPCALGVNSACCTNAAITDKRSCFVEDPNCQPIFVSGDTTNTGVLDPGETWTFTCTKTNVTKNVKNTAIGHGNFNGSDVTFCSSDAAADPFCAQKAPALTPAGTFCDQDECAQAEVKVQNPDTCLTKKATVKKVSATVLYQYFEKNEGDVKLSTPKVVDDECTVNGGTIERDAANDVGSNGDAILDPGETFAFKCTAIFDNITADTSFTDIAYGHGCFTNNAGVVQDVTNSGQATQCGTGTAVFPDPQSDETDSKKVSVLFPTVSGGRTTACP